MLLPRRASNIASSQASMCRYKQTTSNDTVPLLPAESVDDVGPKCSDAGVAVHTSVLEAEDDAEHLMEFREPSAEVGDEGGGQGATPLHSTHPASYMVCCLLVCMAAMVCVSAPTCTAYDWGPGTLLPLVKQAFTVDSRCSCPSAAAHNRGSMLVRAEGPVNPTRS